MMRQTIHIHVYRKMRKNISRLLISMSSQGVTGENGFVWKPTKNFKIGFPGNCIKIWISPESSRFTESVRTFWIRKITHARKLSRFLIPKFNLGYPEAYSFFMSILSFAMGILTCYSFDINCGNFWDNASKMTKQQGYIH